MLPSLLHDRLRKLLPSFLKVKIPTSLGRNLKTCGPSVTIDDDKDSSGSVTSTENHSSCFGSIIDLPGGWKRITDSEIIVISPSGERFRSVPKLEEYLLNQGIKADAWVLFGRSSMSLPKSDEKEASDLPTRHKGKCKSVMTTLPGGWSRRMKWRSSGDRFDTYVYSPDGRIFRSRKELDNYFKMINKVDDIHKYFPISSKKSNNSTTGGDAESTTEPPSSSDCLSDDSLNEKRKAPQPNSNSSKEEQGFQKLNSSFDKKNKSNSSVSSQNVSNPTPLSPQGSPSTNKKVNPPVASLNRIMRFPPTESEGESTDTDSKKVKVKKRLSHNSEGKTKSPLKESNSIFKGFSPILPQTNGSDTDNEINGKGLQALTKNEIDASLSKLRNCGIPPSENENKDKVNENIVNGNKISSDKSIPTRDPSKRKRKKNRIFDNDYETASDDGTFSSVNKNKKKSIEKSEHNENDAETTNIKIDTKLLAAILEKKKRKKELALSSDSDSSKAKVTPKKSTGENLNDSVNKSDENSNTSDIFLKYKKMLTNKKDPIYTSPVLQETSDYSSILSEIDGLSDSSTAPVIVVPTKNKIENRIKSRKMSKFSTEKFGVGWSRKIKWNDEGEGKVASLCSPDGQKIVSSIELLAYFKKAGKQNPDMQFYFPTKIARSKFDISLKPKVNSKFKKLGRSKLPTSSIEPSLNNQSISTSSTFSLEIGPEISSQICELSENESALSSEESQDDSVVVRRDRDCQMVTISHVNGTEPVQTNFKIDDIMDKNADIKIKLPEGTNLIRANTLAKEVQRKVKRTVKVISTLEQIPTPVEKPAQPINEGAGPRVKHVCRSQAQVIYFLFINNSLT